MIISYSKHSSSKNVMKYLRREEGKVLKGNMELTEQLIKQNTNKLKYRSGIISFEGQRPSDEVIQDVIDNFIKSTFAGLEQDQYNILMYEHQDTDNYHIHFVIPRLELRTMKSYNPHWHIADQKRLLLLQDYLNEKHGLSNPFALEKQRTLKNINYKAKNRNKIKEEINEIIEENIAKGLIQNRNDIINLFENSGIEIARITKQSITIKINDVKHRMKGDVYGENFTSVAELGRQLKEREREHKAVTQKQLAELERKLEKYIQAKAEYNRERYKNNTGEHRLGAGALQNSKTVKNSYSWDNSRDNNNYRSNIYNNRQDRNWMEWQNRKSMVYEMGSTEGGIDDRVRTAIDERDRAREKRSEREQEAVREQLKNYKRRISRQYARYTERVQAKYFKDTAELRAKAKRVVRERRERKEEREQIGHFGIKLEELEQNICKFAERLKQSFRKIRDMIWESSIVKEIKAAIREEKEQGIEQSFRIRR